MDHLVGVSNYDGDRDGLAGKPHVGDYQSVDWEKLIPLQAQILLVQYAADRLPPELVDQAAENHLQLLNMQLNTLADIRRELQTLATALGDSPRGEKAVNDLNAQLDGVGAQTSHLPTVSAIIVVGESGLGVAGPGTFLDELLTIAGGRNCAKATGKPYPAIDRETLAGWNPQVIIQLIPDGDQSPQELAAAQTFWASQPQLDAVRNKRIVTITSWYALEPGFRVGHLCQQFASALHPEYKSQSK